MTGPVGPNAFYAPDQGEVDRYRKIMGYSPSFSSHPGLVTALAKANPSHEDMVNVGGFVSALELAKQVRLARASGAAIDLNDEERAYLGAIGEKHDDIDLTTLLRRQQDVVDLAKEPKAKQGGVAGFFGAIGKYGPIALIDALTGAGTSSAVVNNPLSSGILKTFDRAADISGSAYRMGAFGGAPNISDITENVQQAKTHGYDPNNPVDVFAFYFRGEQNFHNMDDLRKQFGAGRVDMAVKFLEDPVGFEQLESDPDNIAQRIRLANDPEFKTLLDAVQSRHVSPGRDLANSLRLAPGSKPFTVVSGSTDALVSWYMDPTLVAGKAGQAVRFSRRGLTSMTDGEGIRRIMTNNGAVRRGWSDFLENARVIREGDDTEKAAAFAKARAETPELVPLMDEINGRRYVVRGGPVQYGPIDPGAMNVADVAKMLPNMDVATRNRVLASERAGKNRPGILESPGVKAPEPERYIDTVQAGPITSLDGLTDYLVDHNALVRLSNGLASDPRPLMPGAVSRYGYRRLKGLTAGAVTGRGVGKTTAGVKQKVIDYEAEAAKLQPTPGDTEGGLNDAANRGQYIRERSSTISARYERIGRRLTTLLPTATTIQFMDAQAPEQVRRFAALFMPKSEANLVAAKYAAGDLADRRAIYKGMAMQVAHSAGLTGSASGQGLYDRMLKGLENLDHQAYSVVEDADTIATDAGLRRVALNDGQLGDTMWLPPFGELRKVSAKLSVYDHVARSVFESDKLDRALPTLRLGWMASFSGGLRNILDEAAGMFGRGMTGEVAKARVTLSQQRALAMVHREVPEADQAAVRSKRDWLKARVFSHLRLAENGLLSRFTDDELNGYVAKLAEDSSQDYLYTLDGLSRAAVGSVVVPRGVDEVREITAAGFKAGEVKFRLDGWGNIPADGLSGARAWAHNLSQWMADPEHAKYILTLARGNTLESEWDRAIQHLLTGNSTKRFREEAEIARPLKTAADDAERQAIARDIVERQTDALRALVLGRDTEKAAFAGQPIHELIDYMETYGRAPSVDWIVRNIPTNVRPEHAIGRKWVPVPVDDAVKGPITQAAGKLARGYSGFLAKFYEGVVSRPAAWASRHPIFSVNYARARRNLKGYEGHLATEGLTPETAEAVVHKLALQHAFDKTVQMVDNPEVASQFSAISRNFFNFERATEDWLRRWGRTFKEDPTRVRRLQLAYEGAEHSGLIDHDPATGEPMFVYPGSGHAVNAMLHAVHVMSLGHLGGVQYPMIPDLHSKVMFLNASLDNPIQLTASPIIASPFKILSSFFPQNGLLFADIDRRFISGQQGAGRPWWDGLLPSVARRFMAGMDDDERNSQVASAARNGILHLEAAGKTPGPGADPAEVQRFIDRVTAQAKNQLVARAIFAFFLPASPSLPENTVEGEPEVDTVFQQLGFRNLKDEYKQLINQVKDPAKAGAIWAKLHPDELIYTVASTETTAPGAYPPVTREALSWIETHMPLFEKYKDVAAYFVPPGHGEFSLDAWNAMLETGLRQNKTIGTYYRDIKVVNAERVYYDAKAAKDKVVAEAHAAGDDDLVRRVRESWSRDSQIFLGQNPLFSEKLNSYGARTIWRQRAVGELEKMIGDPHAAGIAGLDKVALLIQAYRSHDQYTTQMRFRRDAVSQAQKDAEQTAYDQYQVSVVGEDVRLQALYNGVFKGLD